MEALTFTKILDQRKWQFHISVIVMALVVPAILLVSGSGNFSSPDYFDLFLLLFVQLEIFIFIATRIFRKLETGLSSIEFTKTVLLRLSVFLILCFIAELIIKVLFIFFRNFLTGTDPHAPLIDFFSKGFGAWARSTLGGLMFGAAIFIFIQWQDALQREQRLREENLIFQNETLKNQVNPHFLFNSLNTLSALIPEQPDTAEIFINKLASIYRYILENSVKDRVPLQSELAFVSDYIGLHKIRDEGKILLSANTPGSEDFDILPVSLQILIENAIKHNMATREKPLRIHITMEDQYIVVRNNLQKLAVQLRSTGTGLNNLRKRIRLNTGRDLLTEDNGKEFVVKVPLQR
jgi:hypothetical protein